MFILKVLLVVFAIMFGFIVLKSKMYKLKRKSGSAVSDIDTIAFSLNNRVRNLISDFKNQIRTREEVIQEINTAFSDSRNSLSKKGKEHIKNLHLSKIALEKYMNDNQTLLSKINDSDKKSEIGERLNKVRSKIATTDKNIDEFSNKLREASITLQAKELEVMEGVMLSNFNEGGNIEVDMSYINSLMDELDEMTLDSQINSQVNDIVNK